MCMSIIHLLYIISNTGFQYSIRFILDSIELLLGYSTNRTRGVPSGPIAFFLFFSEYQCQICQVCVT